MPFSSDPFSYTFQERAIIQRATGEQITIRYDDIKQATYQRHRFYALRKAIVGAYEKKLLLEAAGKPTAHLDNDLIHLAPSIGKVSVALDRETCVLAIGIGASMATHTNPLDAAMKEYAIPTEEELIQEKIEAAQGIHAAQSNITFTNNTGSTSTSTSTSTSPTYDEVTLKVIRGIELTEEEKGVLEAGPPSDFEKS